MHSTHTNISSLSHAASKVLYTFCKVRGYKVIVRLLNNESRWVMPLLNHALTLDSHELQPCQLSWEEQFIIFLWLSHLMLAPFDLTSIGSPRIADTESENPEIYVGLPPLAIAILRLALRHASAPGKEREAAVVLISRLALRSDMQALGLADRITHFVAHKLQSSEENHLTTYDHVGLLSLQYRIFNLGASMDIAKHLRKSFKNAIAHATSDQPNSRAVRSAAPCRKLLIKIIRSTLVHALFLESKHFWALAPGELETMLEDAIQLLLDLLSDKDTPVRMAAAKNLSMIVLGLEETMRLEVIDAVLDSLHENILLEEPGRSTLIPVTDVPKDDMNSYAKNLSAVDPLKWQGLLLTLAHLLFRRSPSTSSLSIIVESLIFGLSFEQRSNARTSVGVGVRDAACFGLWSVARKYTTNELRSVKALADPQLSLGPIPTLRVDVIQLVAAELVVSACLDPSGNIRRGSSAALQELVGRHPDNVLHGISLVQTIDYHAVARRAFAMCKVGPAAADFDEIYCIALVNSLLGWRGSNAADADSRRLAASAIDSLSMKLTEKNYRRVCQYVLEHLAKVKPSNLGSSAEIRHGLLLALSALLDVQTRSSGVLGDKNDLLPSRIDQDKCSAQAQWIRKVLSDLSDLTGNIRGRLTRDMELVLEGLSTLVKSIAKFQQQTKAISNFDNSASQLLEILEQCVSASDKEVLVESAADAAVMLFQVIGHETQSMIVRKWSNVELQISSQTGFRGRIRTLGKLFSLFHSLRCGPELERMVLSFLQELVQKSWSIEIRSSAMESLSRILPYCFQRGADHEEFRGFVPDLLSGLTDYTIDQRGDIGSVLRLETIGTVDAIFEVIGCNLQEKGWAKTILQQIVKLAAEKLDKIRYQAWLCLLRHWSKVGDFPAPPNYEVSHISDVSSVFYYQGLLTLFHIDWLRKHMILGFTSSATGGTEAIGRPSCHALVGFLWTQPETQRTLYSGEISKILFEHLATIAGQDDREVIPFLDFLALLVCNDVLQFESVHLKMPPERVWSIIQQVHIPSAAIPRLEAILRIYSALSSIKNYKAAALEKTTRLLLHRYPKVFLPSK